MKTSTPFFLSATLVVSACAVDPSKTSYATHMNGLIGKATKLEIAQKYGPPDKQADLGNGIEVWEFRLNENRFTSPTGYRFSNYDRLRITFQHNLLQSWTRESLTD